jgi:hypothetical protein
MVMRKFLVEQKSGAPKPTRALALAAKPPSPPLAPSQATNATAPGADFVDSGLTYGLLAQAATRLKYDDDRANADPHSPVYARAAARMPTPSRGDRAQDILDTEVYEAIRRECPGWDLDVLMKTFDAFLNRNPNEIPRNYSKRFYGFMKKHHERNKYQLPGF